MHHAINKYQLRLDVHCFVSVWVMSQCTLPHFTYPQLSVPRCKKNNVTLLTWHLNHFWVCYEQFCAICDFSQSGTRFNVAVSFKCWTSWGRHCYLGSKCSCKLCVITSLGKRVGRYAIKGYFTNNPVAYWLVDLCLLLKLMCSTTMLLKLVDMLTGWGSCWCM